MIFAASASITPRSCAPGKVPLIEESARNAAIAIRAVSAADKGVIVRKSKVETIKKIAASELRPGMFVHHLDCSWWDHPFLRSSFLVHDRDAVAEILAAGVRDVYIDLERSLDVGADTPSEHAVPATPGPQPAPSPAAAPRVTAAEEFHEARRVHAEANLVVHGILQDVRLGKQVSVEQVEGVVGNIADSILRNPGPLLALCRIKKKDEYTFMHSVSVGTLMMTFCRAAGFDEARVREAGVGGLLHDIGKMTTPDAVLNKPGKLTDDEFSLMRNHVVASRDILQSTAGITPIALSVAAEHHERYDGTGYPQKLKGEQISRVGQMAAIVDVYDAITSDRVYHKGMLPAAALKKMLEWSRLHFKPELVQLLIKSIGIYPTGTLVMLESGRLAVVLDQAEGNLLQPKVRVVYDTRKASFVTPYDFDLARSTGHGGADRIVGPEPPDKWSFDPLVALQDAAA
jgi:putative nucleotidyltransferase with HDIG domain